MNEKINELYSKIDNQDKIINEQALEIAFLNLKINKARLYIAKTSILDIEDKSIPVVIKMLNEIDEILGDKENE